MSHKVNRSKNNYRDITLANLAFLLIFALQYWKPSFYWDSPKMRFQKELIGDRILDILVYGMVAIWFLGMIVAVSMRLAKIKSENQ